MEVSPFINIPIVTIGPIIGKVDENSARILLEIDREADITISLKEVKKKEQQDIIQLEKTYSITNTCLKILPKIFFFYGLSSSTKYEVIIESKVNFLKPELGDLKSFFKTTSREGIYPDSFNLGFISCNSYKYYTSLEQPEFSLWENLSQKVKNDEIDYLIHMGDQIYIDDGAWSGNKENCFSKAKTLWEKAFEKVYGHQMDQIQKIIDQADLESEYFSEEKEKLLNAEKLKLEEIIIELISDVYRATWNIKSVAETLRNAPNLMILDDHEIFDDFGIINQNYLDKSSFEYFFAEKARFCYYKYQKQLLEDIEFDNLKITEKEHHFHMINGVGIFIQDFRGCFSWLKDDIMTHGKKGKLEGFLGNRQTDDIKKCFGNNGIFENMKYAFYVSAGPLVFLSAFQTSVAKEKVNDCYEQWAYCAQDEQIELLDLLVNFKNRANVNTMIVCGDVHIGCNTIIYKDNKPVIEQLITSPICQKPPTNFEMKAVDFLRFSNNSLKSGYSFKHSKGTNKCNYGIVNLTFEDQKYSSKSFLVICQNENFIAGEENFKTNSDVNFCPSCNIL
jgi:phosphodiesterase/alkaline phosphatase D-like protein